MQKTAINGLLAAIAQILSGLSPLAKAVVAAVLPLITALVDMAIEGAFNSTSLIVLLTGAITALGVYFVPNKPAPAAKKPAGK